MDRRNFFKVTAIGGLSIGAIVKSFGKESSLTDGLISYSKFDQPVGENEVWRNGALIKL